MRLRQSGSKAGPMINWIRLTPIGGFIYGASALLLIGCAQPGPTPTVTPTAEAVALAEAVPTTTVGYRQGCRLSGAEPEPRPPTGLKPRHSHLHQRRLRPLFRRRRPSATPTASSTPTRTSTSTVTPTATPTSLPTSNPIPTSYSYSNTASNCHFRACTNSKTRSY